MRRLAAAAAQEADDGGDGAEEHGDRPAAEEAGRDLRVVELELQAAHHKREHHPDAQTHRRATQAAAAGQRAAAAPAAPRPTWSGRRQHFQRKLQLHWAGNEGSTPWIFGTDGSRTVVVPRRGGGAIGEIRGVVHRLVGQQRCLVLLRELGALKLLRLRHGARRAPHRLKLQLGRQEGAVVNRGCVAWRAWNHLARSVLRPETNLSPLVSPVVIPPARRLDSPQCARRGFNDTAPVQAPPLRSTSALPDPRASLREVAAQTQT